MTNEEVWVEVLKHRELLLSVVHQERRKSSDFSKQELMSYGWEGLYKAVKSYSKVRGPNFDAFAQRVIRNAIADGVNKEYRQRGARISGGESVQAAWTRSLEVFLVQLEWRDQAVGGPDPALLSSDFQDAGLPTSTPREIRNYLEVASYCDPDPFEVPESVNLRRAMLRLPAELLDLLFDYYYGVSPDRVRVRGGAGLTLRELAEKHGTSKDTIKRRINEAHEFLRNQMEAMA